MKNKEFIHHLLKLAAKRRGFCAPNPAVGAIVVKNGEILAEGYHKGSGHPHAEIDALQKLSDEQVKDAELYVTLEPCCHRDKKTPPCVDMIIQRKLATVFYCYQDPNPKVNGKGIEKLSAAGIKCHYLASDEINEFYNSYAHWWRTQLPCVTVKLALSLDGKIAAERGRPAKITGNEAQIYTHQQRLSADALLSTSATVCADDPQLNVRLEQQVMTKPLYILDRTLALAPTARVLHTSKPCHIFHGPDVVATKILKLQELGAICQQAPIKDGHLALDSILAIIGAAGVHDLWVEAGGQCFQALLQAGLVNRALIYMAPITLGTHAVAAFTENMPMLASATQVKWTSLGRDALCELRWDNNNNG